MTISRALSCLMLILTTAASVYSLKAAFREVASLPEVPRTLGKAPESHAKVDEHGKPGEFVASPAHGAAPEHGEAKAEGGGHGAGAGVGGGGGHGGAAVDPVDNSVVTLDEFLINLGSPREPEKSFSLGLRLELALFEGADHALVKKSMSGIRNTIIQASREQDYYHLKTTAGKLYFKEVLTQRINSFLNASQVRDVRFTALLFQK